MPSSELAAKGLLRLSHRSRHRVCKMDRHVTADAGPPCQAKIPSALQDKVAKLVCSVVQNPAASPRASATRAASCLSGREKTWQIPRFRDQERSLWRWMQPSVSFAMLEKREMIFSPLLLCTLTTCSCLGSHRLWSESVKFRAELQWPLVEAFFFFFKKKKHVRTVLWDMR